MIDPNDPLEVQVQKQAKIIDALMRRAKRQRDLGPSAFQAFQSAIQLEQKVVAQSLDLERAVTELESARYERERTRRNLVAALSSMDEGFALFSDGKLDLCNELFRTVLPDMASQVRTGLGLERFLEMVSSSAHFVSSDTALDRVVNVMAGRAESFSAVVELGGDRWYQLSVQRTSTENLVFLLTDITGIVRRNRDEKETLIDRQADYLQAVFQNMSPGVCTFSTAGEVMMHNRRFRDMLGLPDRMLETGVSLVRMMVFMHDHGLVRPDERDKLLNWQTEIDTRGELRQRVRHGDDRVLDVKANKLPDGGFVVEIQDVTLEAQTTELLGNRVAERTAELTRANEKIRREYEEKARVEEELRLAKERAEAAVSSKTRFLAAASHDLLQPINAAKLLISTLRETTRNTEFYKMVERLDGAFGSAEQLLHSLLDISRLESPDPDSVSPTEVGLGQLIEGVHADQTLVAEQKGVQLDMVPCSAFVHSDPVYLLRSVQNLVVNAIQYTEAGGRVLVGCRQFKDRVILQVWDTGIGIARKDQARIFEEFARADNVPIGSGMGLGLSVVDRACRVLGHRLSVRSAPGVGSVFSIEMDRMAGQSLPVEPAVLPPVAETDQLDYIVMVIENDPGVLEGMTLWLDQWGASVLAAATIDAAVQHARDIGIAPDIILADYQLDGSETGVDAIAKIRDIADGPVPAILITANRSKALWQAGVQNDISVMAKPVELSRLKVLIDWKIRWQQHVPSIRGRDEMTMPTKVESDG